MNELITKTGEILQQSSELMKNPIINVVLKSFLNWLGDLFSKKSIKEKLKLVEQNKYNEETITEIKENLKLIVEGNNQLQNQLLEKVKEIKSLLKKENMSIKKTTSMNNEGTNIIAIQNNNGKVSIKGNFQK